MNRSEIKRRDREFSLKIRARGKCEICGKQPPAVRLNCAHIFSRRYMRLRWNEDNAFCLCVAHHMWAHDNPQLFIQFAIGKFGPEKYQALIDERNNLEKAQ